MKKLQILMSTYNGERYLSEQLDSLLSQTLTKNNNYMVTILVRDDGSSDGTCDILNKYADEYEEIRYVKGENKGVIESFFSLVDLSDFDADYLAFCDQDDVWMPEKIERAVEKIEAEEKKSGEDKPILYCGRPLLTDANLNPIETVLYTGKVRASFGNALLENVVYGCTSMANRGLINLLRMGHPEFTIMHDRWCYLMASCFGKVIFDENSYICYRQHGVNTVGVKKNRYREFRERLSKFKKTKHEISRQAQSFLAFCEKNKLLIPEQKKTWLLDVAKMPKSVKARIKVMKNPNLYRLRAGDQAVFKILILIGHL